MTRFLRNVLVRNWGLKLFALVLAFGLWLTLIPEEKTFSERTLVVNLERRNLPADFELVVPPPPTIDVTVRAPNRLLSQLTAKDVQAVLNLGRVRLDQQDYPLNPDMIIVPPGAQIVRVFPNMVQLKIERSVQDLMDIQGVTVGKVKEGFVIAKIEIIPPQVNVRGPESKFKAKEKVRTSPIDVTDLDQSATIGVDLILPRPELRFVGGQTRATVLLTIEKKEKK
jgi:YbbR domain-containing protein